MQALKGVQFFFVRDSPQKHLHIEDDFQQLRGIHYIIAIAV